ncbi:glutamate formimidoyltransferase [Bacteroidia bacterium]|jgi:glutamate formiminotransferase/formiminotetrahydrofolate cyclodeaminase|nr:glutamate formimidoyltransferase [Bacteroidia bacterium]
MNKQLIECVPNFSEGRDLNIIKQITNEIESVDGVKLLDVDPGAATNRTVVTFVGTPQAVVDAAYKAIVKAGELIDMSKHTGEHARMGATDVCPFIPVANISMEETSEWAVKLAKQVGETTHIPTYLYGASQPNTSRNVLSIIRAGEYEGFFEKIKKPEWKPDFGPAEYSARSGATTIGARDFLIAYNINLNTKSTRIANRVAFDVRETGRVAREGNPYNGKIIKDENGESVRISGTCKAVQAVGWFIDEYDVAQVSANLTNFNITPIHTFFDEVQKSCIDRGVRITGSELVGLIPLNAMLDAGRHYLQKQGRSLGVDDSELIHIAVKSLGLDELGPFDPEKKIIEYQLRSDEDEKLVSLTAKQLANETASESMAPGGGSIAAYVGALGASLGTMVANLSANKPGWEEQTTTFSDWAVKGQAIKQELLYLVDEDTRSFNRIIDAIRMPKDSEQEKEARKKAIEKSSQYAAEVPYKVMQTAYGSLELLQAMLDIGNPASVTDTGVGALCSLTAVEGACMNVRINTKDLSDRAFADKLNAKAAELLSIAKEDFTAIIEAVNKKIV